MSDESPLVDRRLLRFLLHDWLQVGDLCRYPRFAEHSAEGFDAVIEAAHALALAKFAPHNRASDSHEPRFVDGRVEIIPEVRAALEAYAEAGFPAALADADDGGLQLPYTVTLACDALFAGANVATAGYALLARGVANVIAAHGSESLRARFLPGLLSGRFLGTMCLSEPQAGSSLADIATRAEPRDDGSYRLSGAKMWISGGEHDLADNIVHLVLARIPGGPPGVKGLSLFVVPKFLVGADGVPGARNDVQLAGVNHKLGQRGIVNTFLKFGERGDCVGEIVGAPHQGLAQMFLMMNEARLGVGVGAIMLGIGGQRYSAGYARERRQGRHPDNKDAQAPPLAIIEHADVRRMLLQQKCYGEGALALALHAATLVDAQGNDPDPARRREAGLLLELLTPIVKAWSAEWCTRGNDLAIQVLGGYGYTREYPVEQFWRDNRLNPIHEGANGIQALDLLGRKVLMHDGAALALLLREVRATVRDAATQPELADYADRLGHCADDVERTTAALAAAMARGQARLALANASDYLTLVGHLAIAWTWLRLARAALASESAEALAVRAGCLAACRWFFRRELPVTRQLAEVLQALDDSAFAVAPDAL